MLHVHIQAKHFSVFICAAIYRAVTVSSKIFEGEKKPFQKMYLVNLPKPLVSQPTENVGNKGRLLCEGQRRGRGCIKVPLCPASALKLGSSANIFSAGQEECVESSPNRTDFYVSRAGGGTGLKASWRPSVGGSKQCMRRPLHLLCVAAPKLKKRKMKSIQATTTTTKTRPTHPGFCRFTTTRQWLCRLG